MDGTVFYTSKGSEPLTLQVGVGKSIRGWDEGIC
jgi:FKBP-type peptidyl-prolyl cis-trans isomerase